MSRDSRPRLGRGLSSLIRSSVDLQGDAQYVPGDEAAARVHHPPAAAADRAEVFHVPPDQIAPNPHQPRRTFDQAALAELADSLRTHGLLQPILVARAPAGPDGTAFHVIAGERRLRAAQLAGLPHVPCILRPASRQQMLEMAVIENIHRADLNPIERANAYRDLIDRFGLTQQEVADRTGQARANVANSLRLLDLCNAVQEMILSGGLSFGHGKVLAGLAGRADDQIRLATLAVTRRLSVRQLEALVQAVQDGSPLEDDPADPRPAPSRPPYIVDLEQQLSQAVGTRVQIRPGRRKHAGRIVIHYHGLDHFDRIVAALGATLES